MKQLVILVGLKGSGKSYIGTLLQERLGIRFLRVEDIWLNIRQKRFTHEYYTIGFESVEFEIDKLFKDFDKIVIESTGTTKYFETFLKRIGNRYNLKILKIEASPDTCLKRIRSRDSTIHIPVSDDIIEQVNQAALKVKIEFDGVINNESSSEDEILLKINELIN